MAALLHSSEGERPHPAENAEFTREADELFDIISGSVTILRQARDGDGLRINGKVFRCLISDKNVIYRVRGRHTWYLKFCPPVLMEREVVGAKAVATILADFGRYQHSRAIRLSPEHNFTVYAAFPGRTFNATVLIGCALGGRESSTAWKALHSLGSALGRLHRHGACGELKALNPPITDRLHGYLRLPRASCSIAVRIGAWLHANPVPGKRTWVHGNIKSADIRLHKERASLFDFGTCGLGVPYEDLVGLCTYLLMFRAAAPFPWQLPRRGMSALLRGYAEESDYSRRELFDYLARGVFRTYLRNATLPAWNARLSGIPLARPRVERIVEQMIEGNWERAFEGVDI